MKLSISLAPEDVAILDEYAAKVGLTSRSAAIQHAVRMLKHTSLDSDYAQAWGERDMAGEALAWENVIADGIVDAPR